MMKNILFITSTRIGDAVLSTGVLSYILRTYPEARITVACGPLVESLFHGVPQLEKIIPLPKQSWNRHWLKLWRKTVGKRWDIVIDLRNSIISHLILANHRFAYGPHINRAQHKVAQNASIIEVDKGAAEPRLFLTVEQIENAKTLIPDGRPVLAVGPTANWIGKIWPVENYKELIETLTKEGGMFSGWRIAVFGAPGEECIANHLYESLPEDIRINCIAKGNAGQAAAYLSRCQFYIGNDSGLMHSAAAAGIQTVGLFGPTNDELYSPYGPRTALIRTPETLTQLVGAPGFDAKLVTESLMKNLTVQTVEQGIRDFLK